MLVGAVVPKVQSSLLPRLVQSIDRAVVAVTAENVALVAVEPVRQYTDKGVVAVKTPFKVQLGEGKLYAWCSCGLSKKQPFCDGAHKTVGMTPVRFKMEETREVWLCGCKQTSDRPFCDGTHKTDAVQNTELGQNVAA
ncbi:PREDICTED: CDGSH iron-sulfur domain-containing protein 3, mitochondrial-like isoform X1 [Branchiostoma belcheri]|uniref:CDGSH iron-sulfur domain-containing protein 3, mitochondrial-like isoform X1 n=1 Tax=Branchiostoma belcheri TaxID=7741 RepID=A0A6P4Z3B3_BRABE|nr:PREDICTED: CDGSH iron-sulfur domain-containing protein 3, mitochondrial-like isoform X1 [Branchiostoma belcheri]